MLGQDRAEGGDVAGVDGAAEHRLVDEDDAVFMGGPGDGLGVGLVRGFAVGTVADQGTDTGGREFGDILRLNLGATENASSRARRCKADSFFRGRRRQGRGEGWRVAGRGGAARQPLNQSRSSGTLR
jgi:hypothetical protein